VAPEDVLAYWFGDALQEPEEADRRMRFWFGSDPRTDDEIRARFAPAVKAAGEGAYAQWETEPRPALALVIVLDQFPRNIHRGTAAAFQHDAQALRSARHGVEAGHLPLLSTLEQGFFLMPYQHSEALFCQREGYALFERMAGEAAPSLRAVADEMLKYARLHLEIIERFGRFPHRNAIVGRASTPAELEYLESHGEAFGQGG